VRPGVGAEGLDDKFCDAGSIGLGYMLSIKLRLKDALAAVLVGK